MVPLDVLAAFLLLIIFMCAGVLVSWLRHQAMPKESDRFWEEK